MKRFLLLLLAVFLLAGCTQVPPETTGDTSSSQTEETVGLYLPGASAEVSTAGAVRAYKLESDVYLGIYPMGANLLIVGQKGFAVLSGDEGAQIATLPVNDSGPFVVLDVAATGVAYYSANTRQVVILNPQLQQVTQLTMPETAGEPRASLLRNEIYYTSDKEIRALNISTGISRLLRQQSAGRLSLQGLYFDSAVLAVQMIDETEIWQTQYISTETGQTLSENQNITDLQTYGQRYTVSWQDGAAQHTVVGERGGQAQRFLPASPSPMATDAGRNAVLAMNGVVDFKKTEAGTQFDFYHLGTGKHAAQVTIPDIDMPELVRCDSSYVWIIAKDPIQSNRILYRWDITKSPVEDENHYLSALYTPENPDTEGLTKCRADADTYENDYKVKFAIWQDALKCTGGYTVTAEYQPDVINAMFEELKPVLALFPERFLLKTVEAGWVRIGLVRSIEEGKDWVQFWENGDCWILLSSQGKVRESFIQGLAYGIDSHVLGNSRDFDTWNSLNPEGFTYAYNMQPAGVPEYLTGENKAFTDLMAMSYPHEDRCRVFYNAMLPDNAEMFQSPIMQAKLLRLCTGIREAYGLDKKAETYAWEQYLQTSLAYVK